MDLAMFEGSVDLEKVRHERPAWVERMEQEGNLHISLVSGAPFPLRVVYYVYGFAIIICFFYLMVNAIVNVGELLG
jgi:hypothetical protein